MKKLYTVLLSALILTNAVFCASPKIPEGEADNEDLTLTVQEKSEADTETYTFTYDITNESDKQVSFYVFGDVYKPDGEPFFFCEMKVPKHSSNIYTYTVPKKMWNKLQFGYVGEYDFSLGCGTAEFYDGTKIVVTKDRLMEWEWVEPDFKWSKNGVTNSATTGWKGTNRKISTFSGNYTKWKTKKEKWNKKNVRYILVNKRLPSTNRIIQQETGFV